MHATAPSLPRLAALLGRAPSVGPARALAALHNCPAARHAASERAACSTAAAAAAPALPRRQRHRQLLHRLAASYSVVSDGGGEQGGSGGGGKPWRLIIYSKEGCCLCDGLKEKVEQLLERAQFLPSALSTAELEVRDITSRPEWEAQYSMTIPVLAAAAADGSGEVALPRPSPRFTADALQKHIEKHTAGLLQE
ncbi:glutaredoxin 2 [Chlorella sorokiniana]|uniref:Glutaredoxin-like protein n=1 Tax=Chlorella sorokiniana TaxID=3076 RepID=A0A2P6TDN2_CHLSO|nr:glutaredoxin 2 [Chlorella sorokiniana]|eukprot:PRW20758.1 glutaredoxin 2 [Chlorella sorokiniana]